MEGFELRLVGICRSTRDERAKIIKIVLSGGNVAYYSADSDRDKSEPEGLSREAQELTSHLRKLGTKGDAMLIRAIAFPEAGGTTMEGVESPIHSKRGEEEDEESPDKEVEREKSRSGRERVRNRRRDAYFSAYDTFNLGFDELVVIDAPHQRPQLGLCSSSTARVVLVEIPRLRLERPREGVVIEIGDATSSIDVELSMGIAAWGSHRECGCVGRLEAIRALLLKMSSLESLTETKWMHRTLCPADVLLLRAPDGCIRDIAILGLDRSVRHYQEHSASASTTAASSLDPHPAELSPDAEKHFLHALPINPSKGRGKHPWLHPVLREASGEISSLAGLRRQKAPDSFGTAGCITWLLWGRCAFENPTDGDPALENSDLFDKLYEKSKDEAIEYLNKNALLPLARISSCLDPSSTDPEHPQTHLLDTASVPWLENAGKFVDETEDDPSHAAIVTNLRFSAAAAQDPAMAHLVVCLARMQHETPVSRIVNHPALVTLDDRTRLVDAVTDDLIDHFKIGSGHDWGELEEDDRKHAIKVLALLEGANLKEMYHYPSNPPSIDRKLPEKASEMIKGLGKEGVERRRALIAPRNTQSNKEVEEWVRTQDFDPFFDSWISRMFEVMWTHGEFTATLPGSDRHQVVRFISNFIKTKLLYDLRKQTKRYKDPNGVNGLEWFEKDTIEWLRDTLRKTAENIRNNRLLEEDSLPEQLEHLEHDISDDRVSVLKALEGLFDSISFVPPECVLHPIARRKRIFVPSKAPFSIVGLLRASRNSTAHASGRSPLEDFRTAKQLGRCASPTEATLLVFPGIFWHVFLSLSVEDLYQLLPKTRAVWIEIFGDGSCLPSNDKKYLRHSEGKYEKIINN